MKRLLLAASVVALAGGAHATSRLPLVVGDSGYNQQLQPSDVINPYGIIDQGLTVSQNVCTDTNKLLISCGGGSGPVSHGIAFTFDGAGTALSSSTTPLILPVPFNCTINGWAVATDQSGSIAFDVEMSVLATYPPTASIVASAPPAISSSDHNQSTTLTGWTTAIVAYNWMKVSITSATTITKTTLVISCAS